MKILIKNVIIVLLTVLNTQGECNVCHTTNNEACRSETEYSLCIRGKPNDNVITCPEDYVCTSGPYVCYPRKEVEPSCKRHQNLCGICSANKVFACINETTIAFCYGEDQPVKGAGLSYCLGGTVCDINSKYGFCTERKFAQPSCITSDDFKTTIATEPNFSTATPRDESTETATTTTASTSTIELATPEAGAATTGVAITGNTTRKTPMVLTTTTKTIEAASTSVALPTTAQTATIEPRDLTSATAETTTTSSEITAEQATQATITTTTETAATQTTMKSVTATAKTTTYSGEITAATASKAKPITTKNPTTTEFTTTTTELLTSESTTERITPDFVLTTPQTTQFPSTRMPEMGQRATTPFVPRSPNSICRDAASTGSFYAGDPTCSTFIVCYVSGGALAGIKKSCRPGQYFPPGAVYCSSEKPDICM